ncbi:MAG: M28 family peptidase [Promethearchaeota archaeon]
MNISIINTEKLFEYVKLFSFPRLAGTEGERKAVKLVSETFKKIGFQNEQITKQNFEFSNFYSTIFIKLMIVMNIFIISILLLVKYLYPFLILIIICIMFIILISTHRLFRHPELNCFWEKHFGKNISATNVFAKIPADTSSQRELGDIIVSAHLDSKSQTYQTIWRVLLFRIWMYFEIFFGICYFIFIIDYHEFSIYFRETILIFEFFIGLSAALVILSNFFLLFLNTENKSLGALDNASGMSIVFELSSFFKINPLNNFNIWFCQFSAEEIGTMGSRNFIDKYEYQFVKGKTFQINFDMVSAQNLKKNQVEFIKSYGLLPRKKISPILNDYIQESARLENININSFHVTVGAHTDSIPFHLRKFDSIDITTRSAAKYTHSREDVPEKVDPIILTEAYSLVRRIILLLDDQYDLS